MSKVEVKKARVGNIQGQMINGNFVANPVQDEDLVIPQLQEPTDAELTELESMLEELGDDLGSTGVDHYRVQPGQTVEQHLDAMDLERLEWDRVSEDLYPERVPSGPKRRGVHKANTPIQKYLARERQNG